MILISLAAVAVAFILVFYLCLDPLMSCITRPITSRGIDIVYTALSEALTTKIKVALIAAAVAASPVIVWQVWGFIRPALQPKGQRFTGQVNADYKIIGLSSKRKYVILAVFIVAAVLTPPDVVSQVALGVPLCLLYEAGILAARTIKT